MRSHILEKGWESPYPTGGGVSVPPSHLVSLEDLPGVTSVKPVSKGAFFCHKCRMSRTVPAAVECPPSSSAMEIDPGTLGPLTPLGHGGCGTVLVSTWEGHEVVVKEVLADKADIVRNQLLVIEGRVWVCCWECVGAWHTSTVVAWRTST